MTAATTKPPVTATPPGWYPNPEGPGQRYFDGNQWTDQYAAPTVPASQKKPRTFLKVFLGVIVGGTVLLLVSIAGCAAIIGGAANEVQKDEQAHAIGVQQFRSVDIGATRSQVIADLGVQPGDAQEFENEGLPGSAVKSSCIYYNETGKGLGEGQYFQFCFDNGKLTGKNAY